MSVAWKNADRNPEELPGNSKKNGVKNTEGIFCEILEGIPGGISKEISEKTYGLSP